MSDDLATIPARFNGPPNSGNGGYSCGILGALIGDCAEVTLRMPPPIETDMVVHHEGDDWSLLAGDDVIATGRSAELELEVPAPPSLDEALAAEPAYSGFEWHLFKGCFVCGPDREEHDGLRLFTGKLPGRDVVASHWDPGQDVAGEFGEVQRRIVWAALDCPTYFGGRVADFPKVAVLGRLTVKIVNPVRVGHRHIVIGWPIEAEGRKWHGGSAIYTEAGELCAFSRGTWVVIPEDHAGFDTAG